MTPMPQRGHRRTLPAWVPSLISWFASFGHR
jgi:hypothetical protein